MKVARTIRRSDHEGWDFELMTECAADQVIAARNMLKVAGEEMRQGISAAFAIFRAMRTVASYPEPWISEICSD